MSMHKLRKYLVVAAISGLTFAAAMPAVAKEPTIKPVDWTKLNLNAQQTQQINQLESDWKSKYAQAQPRIVEAQKKLEALLPNPKSDPLEIMSTQQTVARLKENLRNEATTNYLRKRAILNETQQHQLEGMLQQMVSDRQRVNSAAQGEQSPGIQNIVNKIKWAIEPH